MVEVVEGSAVGPELVNRLLVGQLGLVKPVRVGDAVSEVGAEEVTKERKAKRG